MTFTLIEKIVLHFLAHATLDEIVTSTSDAIRFGHIICFLSFIVSFCRAMCPQHAHSLLYVKMQFLSSIFNLYLSRFGCKCPNFTCFVFAIRVSPYACIHIYVELRFFGKSKKPVSLYFVSHACKPGRSACTTPNQLIIPVII